MSKHGLSPIQLSFFSNQEIQSINKDALDQINSLTEKFPNKPYITVLKKAFKQTDAKIHLFDCFFESFWKNHAHEFPEPLQNRIKILQQNLDKEIEALKTEITETKLKIHPTDKLTALIKLSRQTAVALKLLYQTVTTPNKDYLAVGKRPLTLHKKSFSKSFSSFL